jgi:hypothetical protein
LKDRPARIKITVILIDQKARTSVEESKHQCFFLTTSGTGMGQMWQACEEGSYEELTHRRWILGSHQCERRESHVS